MSSGSGPSGNKAKVKKTEEWWTIDLAAMRRKLRAALKVAMATKSPEDWHEYRTTQKVYKQRIRTEKTQTRLRCQSGVWGRLTEAKKVSYN